MKCYVCDASDWHKMPGLHSKMVIQACKKCGNLCHDLPDDYEAKLLEFYRTSYREPLSAKTLITTNNKLQYFSRFMADFLRDKKGLVCGDIGAATGYILKELQARGHKVTGCEYTLTCRRFAQHFYGIPLTEELSEKRKYDLLVMYHTLEHMVKPDEKLAKFKALLADGGHMLISTPFWLEVLDTQDGSALFDGGARGTPQAAFDHLYHKNHINIFTRSSITNLFRKAGLAVVKDDFVLYGQSYLVKAATTEQNSNEEDWQTIEKKLRDQKKALELFAQGKYQDATRVWPNFPDAWLTLIFRTYGKEPDRQMDTMGQMPKSVRSSPKFQKAEVFWLWQRNRYEEALALIELSHAQRPDAELVKKAAETLMLMGRYQEAMQAFTEVVRLHPYLWIECYDYIVQGATSMPTWDEQGRAKLKELLLKQATESGHAQIEEPDVV